MKGVRRLRRGLRMCLEFLHTGEIQPRGERHPFSLWYCAVTEGQAALGERLKLGEDGKLRWQRIRAPRSRDPLSKSGRPTRTPR